MYKTVVIIYKNTINFKIAILLLTAVSFFLPERVNAQEKNFTYYDTLTYNMYLKQDYKNLIKAGNKALNSDIDYYYLRMRMGIAAYNLKQYRLAVSHFKKAAFFDNNDIVAEYLYYSYVFGGMPLEARQLQSTMSPAMKKKTGAYAKKVLSINVDIAAMSSIDNIPDDFAIPHTEDGSQIIPDNFFNASFGISHYAGKKAVVSHIATYLKKNNIRYSFYENEEYYDPSFNTNQLQYYISTAFSVSEKVNIILAGQISTASVYEYSERWYQGSNHIVKTTEWYQDFALSASAVKNFTRFSVEGELSFTRINETSAFQPSAIIRLYPFADLNLYTSSRFSLLSKNGGSTLFQQHKIGFKILNHLWLEADYFTGNVSGFTLENSALLFNGSEELNNYAGINVIVPTNKKLSLSAGYQQRVQTNYFIDTENTKSNSLKINYSLFYFSLLWTL